MGMIDQDDKRDFNRLEQNKVPAEEALIKVSKNPADLRIWIDKGKRGKLKYSVDIAKCIDLSLRGVPIKDIATLAGLNPDNKRAIKWLRGNINRFKPDINPHQLNVYKGFRSQLLQQKQALLLDSINEEAIADATLRDLVFAYDKLFDKERLNDDKSTGNVAHQYSHIVEEIHSRRGNQEVIVDE